MATTLRRLAMSLGSAALVASIALAAPGPGPGRPDDDDDDEAKAAGRRAFVENCLICHGEDMTSNQRLSAKQWTAEVEKMVGWGAPVPSEQKAGLLAYLTTTYPAGAAPPPPDVAPAAGLLAIEEGSPSRTAGDLARGGPLYAQHCATCHGPEGRGGDLGPRLAERSVLLRDAAYHKAVRKGVRRMPGFASVLGRDAEDDLLAWLRSRRGEGPTP